MQILLVISILHLLVDRVVDGLQRVERSLHRIGEQSQDGIGNGGLLNRLGGLLECFLQTLLHTIETLVGGLSILVELLQQILGDSQIHPFTRGDAVNQTLRQFIGTERHVLSILISLLDSRQHHVLILISRIVELTRLNGT